MNKEFASCIRDYVSQQKRKNPALSEVALSKKMDIPPTTFNRLVNGHSQPNIATLSKLIKNIPALKNCLPEDVKKAFQVIFETQAENALPLGNGIGFKNDLDFANEAGWTGEASSDNLDITKDKSHLLRQNKTEYNTEKVLENLLSDKYVCLCYLLAQTKEEITTEEIQYHFGQKGLKALDTLVTNNILLKRNKGWYLNDKDSRHFSFQLAKEIFMSLSEQYDPDDTRHNYIHGSVESVNEEGLDKLVKAHREFHKKVFSIVTNKNYKGDKPYFSIACCDFLVKNMEEKPGSIKETHGNKVAKSGLKEGNFEKDKAFKVLPSSTEKF